MIIRDKKNDLIIDTDGYEKIWYAVQETSEDEWDFGSDNYDKASKMLHKQGFGLIAVIDDVAKVCLASIEYEDLFDKEKYYIMKDPSEYPVCVTREEAEFIMRGIHEDFDSVWREATEEDIENYGVD